ncbi:MAG TPA: hypothetical protein DIU15_06530, partial [Deltaproteobacteria bacterium]|nr:hypothetical protein [Deltaproteobacteria bacterium]
MIKAACHRLGRKNHHSGWASLCALLVLCAVISTAHADSGSDEFGYTWADSSSGGPAYNYEEVLNQQAQTLADEGFVTIALGFEFLFYGEAFSQVDVHSNGVLTFGASNPAAYNHQCPLSAPELPTISPYWTDLNPAAAEEGGGVYIATRGSQPNRYLIVEWFKIPHFNVQGEATFEVKLFEGSNRIEFHYRDLNVGGDNLDYGRGSAIFIGSGERLIEISCDEESFHGESFNNGVGETLEFNHPACDDQDIDGYCSWEDCDNNDASVNPGVDESCDKIDNDCDGEIDESTASDALLWYLDNDGDGYGNAGVNVPATSCDPPTGYADNNIDCDDNDRNIFPGAHEACDNADNDCDGIVDNPSDSDGDGATICDGDCDDSDPTRENLDVDRDGQSTCGGDCNDNDDRVETGSAESCDGVDNDCDG